ncbi:hypothetical protein D3C85_1582420 [compost metagenome]
MLGVEPRGLEGLAACVRLAGNHEGQFAGQVQEASAVVAQIHDQLRGLLGAQFADGVHQLQFRGLDVIVELQVADPAARVVLKHLDVLDGGRGDVRGRHRDLV